jgi:shikimate dehydrogenase
MDNYAVVGNPVAHSKSPVIHQTFARQCGLNISYQAIRIETGGFAEALVKLRLAGIKGLNVTVPFKGDAWANADVLTDRARRAGAVNTLWFPEDGMVYGDTTDGTGLVIDLDQHSMSLAGKRLLLLGAGGAVRGVLKNLYEQAPEEICIVNRSAQRVQQLAADFSDCETLHICALADLPGKRFDVVINGTSASLQGELIPLPADILATGACCYDMAYADGDTVFIQWAKQHGARTAVDGLGMLVEQAAASFYIWTGIHPDTGPVIEMLRHG